MKLAPGAGFFLLVAFIVYIIEVILLATKRVTFTKTRDEDAKKAARMGHVVQAVLIQSKQEDNARVYRDALEQSSLVDHDGDIHAVYQYTVGGNNYKYKLVTRTEPEKTITLYYLDYPSKPFLPGADAKVYLGRSLLFWFMPFIISGVISFVRLVIQIMNSFGSAAK